MLRKRTILTRAEAIRTFGRDAIDQLDRGESVHLRYGDVLLKYGNAFILIPSCLRTGEEIIQDYGLKVLELLHNAPRDDSNRKNEKMSTVAVQDGLDTAYLKAFYVQRSGTWTIDHYEIDY